MNVDGACHCGKLAYEAEIDPERIGVCHCVDCQLLSGTAFRIAARVPLLVPSGGVGASIVMFRCQPGR